MENLNVSTSDHSLNRPWRPVYRKIVVLFVLFFILHKANAQIKENVKLAMEVGFLPLSASKNLGLFLNVEPKLKITKKSFAGIRVGLVINPQKFENNAPQQFEILDEFDNGGLSFVPTFDYYLSTGDYRPYLGLGVGAYLLSKYVDVVSNTSVDEYEVIVSKQAGILFRGGIETGKFKFGIEYNLLQKADIQLTNGQVVGTVDNSYFGFGVGYTIGGGKR